MAKASDNVFPRFLISEGGSTATPAAGNVTVYAKANGLLYSKDDAGAETALGATSAATELLAYKKTTSGDVTTTSTTLADADATNLAVTFTAPASTNVLVRLSARCAVTAGNVGDYVSWGVRESTTDVAGSAGNTIVMRIDVAPATRVTYQWVSIAFVITGISAGSHTYKWSHAAIAASTVGIGANANCPAIMEVWSV